MAGSVNKVILLGNLGRDPDVRTMQNGKKVCTLSIATSDSWKDKETGEKKEKTEWHRVVVFNEGLVGVVENYVKKGSKLYIEGSLQTRKWTDDSGTEKYTTEVVIQGYGGRIDMLDSKSTGDSITENTGEDISKKKDSSQNKNSEGTENVKKNDSSDELDDEIPF
tara:strand:- start:211 stop:705 length:495 start_codon:yes stop_codon:yes gene_type:complete